MKIIKFDHRKRKLSLSLRQYVKEQERNEVETYLSSEDAGVPTLGDMIGKAIQERKQAQEEAAKGSTPIHEEAGPETEGDESTTGLDSEAPASVEAEPEEPKSEETEEAREPATAAEGEPEPQEETPAGENGSPLEKERPAVAEDEKPDISDQPAAEAPPPLAGEDSPAEEEPEKPSKESSNESEKPAG
jgi:hypothetical protein